MMDTVILKTETVKWFSNVVLPAEQAFHCLSIEQDSYDVITYRSTE